MYMGKTLGFEKGAAYHLDIALTVVFDGNAAGAAGVMVLKIKSRLAFVCR